jgi:membrane-bound metal-dependent hydrolase YbcI (DUF457 family)
MNARAGVVGSQVVWFASLPVMLTASTLEGRFKDAVAGFIFAGLASFMPDLDHHNSTVGRYVPRIVRKLLGGHRMGSHSFLSVAVAWWLTGYLLDDVNAANAVAVGWSWHIFIDMLTIDGAGVLYPLTRKKFRIGWMRTGSKGEDRFVTGVKWAGVAVAICYGYLFIAGGY